MIQGLEGIIKAGCFLSFFIASSICSGQFSDTFSDGNFSESPPWQGSTSNFIVNGAGQLQSSNTASSISQLSASFVASSLSNYEWQFYVKQTFAPSASNYGRVYLVSDQSDLTGPLNGYYLQFGEALSSDAVELFRQTGSVSVSIGRATNGAIASAVNLRVRVLRSDTGVWQLFIDYSGGNNFILEASGADVVHNSSAFFGIRCVYTVSNANKFFFDDFYAGPEILDTTPPLVVSANPISPNQLDVIFNEKIDATTSQLSNNYFVNNDVGAPLTAALQADKKTVQLTFSHPFPNGVESQLTVSGVKDLFDNTATTQAATFLFFQPVASQWKDIIITEIFADPSPSVGLPEAEFIEIFNRSMSIVDLQYWEISDGGSRGILPSLLIFPGDYVILTSAASVSQFISQGTVIGVSNFPTLNNSGDPVSLSNNGGILIDRVNYSNDWYHDEDKMQGGFTLELIDPANLCAEEGNWIAAESPIGGTPGRQNSVFANKPDATGPRLVAAVPSSKEEIIIHFNEKMDDELPALSGIAISPAISISQISFLDGGLKSLQLLLSSPLEAGTKYTLQIQNMYDCTGNIIDLNFNSLFFGLPEQADVSDVVINEILFNPRPMGVDFVEVYNNSIKFINLKNWHLANYVGGLVTNAKAITTEDLLLPPNQYMVFTEDMRIVKGDYILAVEQNIIEIADLPSLNDDEGTVALINTENKVIDFFNYTDNYHSIFINDNEGVSLERISFNEVTTNQANWKSASSTVGYATPGYINSNISGKQTEGKITVTPEVFEPVTGQPSFTQIQYKFERGGFVANVRIVDTQGREVKQLVNNETLGTEGFFRWDGDTNDGGKARMGYYIVWLQIFNNKGEVDTFRRRVVVAARKK
jgi:hypothetical protein